MCGSYCLYILFLGYNLIYPQTGFEFTYGAITRAHPEQKEIALVFTGDEFADGSAVISRVLNQQAIKASFFLTGRFYRNPTFDSAIKSLVREGHYLGAHSDDHLLYCDWNRRDSLLVTKQAFMRDLENNYLEMRRFGIEKQDAQYYLPPYEWYNDTIAAWTDEFGLQLINYTAGTLSHADYTVPDMSNYRSSEEIFDSILVYERSSDFGLNGFILLMHVGTSPERTDKFYHYLDPLIVKLKNLGYSFRRIDELLNIENK